MNRGQPSWGSNPTHSTPKLRRQCFIRDHWTCQGCGYQSPRRDGRDLIADHVRNLARGGARTLANLQTLCPPCHIAKTQAEAKAGRNATRRQRPKPIHPADTLRSPPCAR